MSKSKTQRVPDCPSCGDSRAVHAEGDRGFYCTFCRVAFDGDPDEGGDYSSSDPAWRIMRAEARAERKREEKARAAKLPPGFRRVKT